MLKEESDSIVTVQRIFNKPPRLGIPAGIPRVHRSGSISYQILPNAQAALNLHVRSNPTTEVGGLLMGEVYNQDEGYLVLVTDILPARYTVSGPVRLVFTAESWIDLINRRRQLPLDKQTVGWYHSHPGIGLFLSGDDLFLHRNFFGDQPWYLAIVADPIATSQAIFVWNQGNIVVG